MRRSGLERSQGRKKIAFDVSGGVTREGHRDPSYRKKGITTLT